MMLYLPTLNENDAVNDEPRVVAKRRPDQLDAIDAAIERAKFARAFPSLVEETWQEGRISNGEVL